MNDKPKCPVFGCTIPRGIPHEHAAGLSAVMRDPAAPLNADERAELERYRAEDEQDRRTVFVRSNLNSKHYISLEDMHARYAEPGSLRDEAMRRNNVYVLPDDAKIHFGQKLRDSIAEFQEFEKSVKIDEARYEADIAAQNIQMAVMAELMNAPLRLLAADIRGMDFVKETMPAPRRTLAQSIGKIMSWLLGIPCLLLMCFVIGHQFGWWV